MDNKPKGKEKLLAYENANQECQKAIAPILETGTIIDYLKACRNLGSETQKMKTLAETMIAALRKENEGCFTCGDKDHLKRDNRQSRFDAGSLGLVHWDDPEG